MRNLLLSLLLLSSTPAVAEGGYLSLGGLYTPAATYGGRASDAWGITLGLRGQKPGEIAFSYIKNSVAADGALPEFSLSIYELDLRHRFGEKYGFYLGLPLLYFVSSNESISDNGFTLGAQAGYDVGFGEGLSVGVHGHYTFAREFGILAATLKIWLGGHP